MSFAVTSEAGVRGYNFTERVRRVLSSARTDAVRLKAESVAPEHVWMALLREPEGVASAVLQTAAVDRAAVVRAIEDTLHPGAGPPGDDDLALPFTSRAKKVLERSMGVARDLRHSYVGTEHLLLALLHDAEESAAPWLADLRLTRASARAEVLRLLGQQRADAADRGPPAIDSVTVEIRYADGSREKGDFSDRAEAIRFLR
jgi:ATP-dependent Clp protease ATP-binding subunit ClpC